MSGPSADKPQPSSRGIRAALAGICVGAALMAATWAFLVPIFQAPDEPMHLDYALSIASAGHLLNARENPIVQSRIDAVVHPDSQYLMQATGWSHVYSDYQQRMASGYGTLSYFKQLDENAPPHALDLPPSRTPGLLAVYPAGYYILLAAWIRLTALLTPSLTVLFFSARLLSVLLLPLTLLLSFGVARELGVGPRLGLLLVAAIAFFPITPFMASAIQPDNLAWFLLSLAIYLGLVARRRDQPAPLLGGLGLVLGLLLFTKLQFAVCAAIPLLSTLFAERLWRPARSTFGLAVPLVSLPAMAFLAIHLWVVWGTTMPLSPTTAGIPLPSQGVPNAAAFSAAVAQGLAPFLAYALAAMVRAGQNFYLGGQSFRTFWGTVGWLEAPLQFGFAPIGALVRALEVTWTLAVMGLALTHFTSTSRRLVRVAQRHRQAVALRLSLSDPFLAGYMMFTAFMFGMFVLTDGTFLPQGRNWLPFLLPTWMLALRYAPRILRRRRPALAVSFTRMTAGALLLFCVAGSAFALATLEHRFYGVFPTFSG